MGNSTLFRDLLFLGMLGFVAMVALMEPYLNPPAEDVQTEPPGNLIVTVNWPRGNNDVDLWLLGPGMPSAVGYSNLGSHLWNLLRDDLGNEFDPIPDNFENAYSRGIPEGRYWINIHCYRCNVLPVRVQVEVRRKSLDEAGNPTVKPVFSTEIELTYSGEEQTAVSFRTDRKGKIMEQSKNHLFKPLRTARK